MKTIQLQSPLTEGAIMQLHAGETVSISGIIYTARDAAHKRLCAAIDNNTPLPIDLRDQIIYFTGPTPAQQGRAIGSAGPTTSTRMDTYSPILIEKAGIRGMIGKGNRNAAVIAAMKKFGCIYFAATGGAGALLAQKIIRAEVVCYEDLGAEAIFRLDVTDFPVVVAIDCYGVNLYESGPAQFRK